MATYFYRDSISGRIVSADYAGKNPNTTQRHKIGTTSRGLVPGEFWTTRDGTRVKILHRFSPDSGYDASRLIVVLARPGDIRQEELYFTDVYGHVAKGQEDHHDLAEPWDGE